MDKKKILKLKTRNHKTKKKKKQRKNLFSNGIDNYFLNMTLKTQAKKAKKKLVSSTQFNSVALLCPTLCDPMNHSTPGLPVHHQLPESTQTHVH